jgi:Tol biopolymer transport system component
VVRLTTSLTDDYCPIWSPDGSKIFFQQAYRPSHIRHQEEWECYISVVSSDGGDVEKLVEKESYEGISNVILSPDGKKIAFWAEGYLYVVDSDGSNLIELAKTGKRYHVWGADGSKIFYLDLPSVYVTYEGRLEELWRAFVINADGTGERQIAELTLAQGISEDGMWLADYNICSWSPDRTKILLFKQEETGYIWVWSEDEEKWKRYESGTEPPAPVLTKEPFHGLRLARKEVETTVLIWDLGENKLNYLAHLSYGPAGLPRGEEAVWSPNGKYVALWCHEISEEGLSAQIYTVDVESGAVEKLTSFLGVNMSPAWNLDGEHIMYLQSPLKWQWVPFPLNWHIWITDAGGGNKTQLTDSPMNEEGKWSPDGRRIAYISYPSGFPVPLLGHAVPR